MANEYQEFRDLDVLLKIYWEKYNTTDSLHDLYYWRNKIDVSTIRYIQLNDKLFKDNWSRYVITKEQRNILRNRLNFYKILDPEGS
jgi:hypothetical protein